MEQVDQVAQVIELVLSLAAMVFVLMGKRELHPVPKMMGIVSGVLLTISMVAAGAPLGASLASGLVFATLLGEIGDHFLERY